MATNAEPVDDDDKEVTEDDLRDLKYPEAGVENSDKNDDDDPADDDEADNDSDDAGDDDSQTDDDTEIGDEADSDDESDEDEPPAFVKQFPNIKGDTPEEYAKNLEIAYNNSTAEFKRLRDEADKSPDDTNDTADVSPDPTSLYVKQQIDREIREAFSDFSGRYSQVEDPVEYDRFTRQVKVLSQTILDSEGRLATPAELYDMAAVTLKWEANDKSDKKDRINRALKDSASSSRTSSGSANKPKSKSKVTDAMIMVNRKMYPGKTDADIRKELEAYIT